MVTSAESVVVARTTEEVFRYVADLRNEPNWHVDIASVPSETDPVPVVGKTYALKFKPFMSKTDGTFTALEVEQGARVVYQGNFAGLQPRITYTVEPAGDGTRFTRDATQRAQGADDADDGVDGPAPEQGLRPESQARPRILRCATAPAHRALRPVAHASACCSTTSPMPPSTR
jgi:uncharacterized protein YndB with AHSA1/START domain